ncbi:unnamed protein product [Amoebophrya sp. A120]|nr:unnamed protein product [Amoebophrya sp. A120]|eukprot:GSA120T00015211001.1
MAGAADHDRSVSRRQTGGRFRPALKALVKTFITSLPQELKK